MLKYKVDILELLKEKGYNTYYFYQGNVVSQSTLQYFRNGTMVGPKALNQICTLLKCQPGDLIEWVPDDSDPKFPEPAQKGIDKK